MNRSLLIGFSFRPWKCMDQVLQRIGKSAAWPLTRRRSAEEESTVYAATGGALLCLMLGGIAGFALSVSSRNIDPIDGAVLGVLLGMFIGIMFGACVETVDRMISDLLKSLDSK